MFCWEWKEESLQGNDAAFITCNEFKNGSVVLNGVDIEKDLFFLWLIVVFKVNLGGVWSSCRGVSEITMTIMEVIQMSHFDWVIEWIMIEMWF